MCAFGRAGWGIVFGRLGSGDERHYRAGGVSRYERGETPRERRIAAGSPGRRPAPRLPAARRRAPGHAAVLGRLPRAPVARAARSRDRRLPLAAQAGLREGWTARMGACRRQRDHLHLGPRPRALSSRVQGPAATRDGRRRTRRGPAPRRLHGGLHARRGRDRAARARRLQATHRARHVAGVGTRALRPRAAATPAAYAGSGDSGRELGAGWRL